MIATKEGKIHRREYNNNQSNFHENVFYGKLPRVFITSHETRDFIRGPSNSLDTLLCNCIFAVISGYCELNAVYLHRTHEILVYIKLQLHE